MRLKKLIPAILVVAFFSTATFANNTDPKNDKEEVKKGGTIVSVAASNENFTTLVAAVKAAGLVDVLNSDGPFTVFAPVNTAFAKLPEGTVGTLLKPENKKLLTAILTYHVVAGKFNASDVVKAIKANKGKFVITTVQGGKLTASISNGNVILTDVKGNTSKVIITDVKASNGIIHAIDSVVMPQ
tara:strand:+ start:21301 stop:21855 length:555 start_codon:yes stop_codon:yes gene_type:complete